MKRVLLQWLPITLWMFVIFFVSHQPIDSIPQYGVWDTLLKKGGHVTAYAILAILAIHAGFNPGSAFSLSVAYAISDELHQRHVAGRNGTVEDVLIDSLGVLIGLLVFRFLLARRHRSQ